ncbi:hypothetical protein ACFXG4_03945 [Nocardia sp. NPDC059246]|uniref:hypothetical protein n=1 Tax=Nocardia sp. NPDC059246 TaxID=3346789 RepID=UPI003688B1B9
MPDRTITTASGSTVTLTDRDGDLIVLLDHPDAPADMRPTEAGRVIDGGFQPAPFAAWGLRPSGLRAIADLIEGVR